MINKRFKWRGHLWQDRFSSFPLGQEHLIAAVRYIELNPISAGLARRPEDYPWSSARAHMFGEPDALLKDKPVLGMVEDWSKLLASGMPEEERESFRLHERSGKPMGAAEFVGMLETVVGRSLKLRGPGRPTKIAEK